MTPIVSAAWLADHLDEVAVVHVGTAMEGSDPSAAYMAGHLPGARFVSLDDDLAAPAAPILGRHPLPTPEAFAVALGVAGVPDDVDIVAYDDRGGAFAARLVWMLRIIGQGAALLDGGSAAWTGSRETGVAHAVGVQRRVVEWPEDAMADSDAVAGHVARGGVVVDSREGARYRGEAEPIDAVAGHVPGAINLSFADNLVDGHFRGVGELRERFSALQDDPQTIVYCGSGVTACHNALAIEAAGLPRPRVYVGSWSGWSTEPGRPVAR